MTEENAGTADPTITEVVLDRILRRPGAWRNEGRQKNMVSLKHKEYRVVWMLNNGRLMYSSKRNWPELWSLEEIDQLVENRKEGFGCYTPDLGLYFSSVPAAHQSLAPERRDGLVLITGYFIQRGTQKVVEDWLPSNVAEQL